MARPETPDVLDGLTGQHQIHRRAEGVHHPVQPCVIVQKRPQLAVDTRLQERQYHTPRVGENAYTPTPPQECWRRCAAPGRRVGMDQT
ncbi:hypothetical protein Aph02nite_79730 [Actinoplanes philippinensis]|nr:hypothetical protein Aph02nite_79730 [Actinoplanes philippinensis]